MPRIIARAINLRRFDASKLLIIYSSAEVVEGKTPLVRGGTSSWQ